MDELIETTNSREFCGSPSDLSILHWVKSASNHGTSSRIATPDINDSEAGPEGRRLQRKERVSNLRRVVYDPQPNRCCQKSDSPRTTAGERNSKFLTPSEIRSGSDPVWISEGGWVEGWGRANSDEHRVAVLPQPSRKTHRPAQRGADSGARSGESLLSTGLSTEYAQPTKAAVGRLRTKNTGPEGPAWWLIESSD